MTDDSPLTDDYVPRKEVQEQLVQRLDSDDTLVQIAGQPGVGKTYLLNWAEEEFEEEYAVERVRLGTHHSIQTLTQKVYRILLNDISESVKEGNRELTGASGSAVGFGGGLSWTREQPDWTENPFEYIEALDEMIDHVPDDYKRLICLDDIHNLDADEQKIKDALIEIADVLGPEITFLSAGRVQFTDDVSVIRLSTFSEAQTVELLRRETSEIEDGAARELHTRLSGHPYYLGLLVDIEDPAAAVEVPQEDIHEYIETEYLDALSEDEERFLQATSPLFELDEHVCSTVLSDDEFDQVAVRRLLRGLEKRVIVQDLGTGFKDVTQYTIHDKFRDFLLQHESNSGETHVAAFDFYAGKIRDQITSDELDFEQGTYATTLCTHHLTALIEEQKGTQEIVDVLDAVLSENGIPFYTATILLDELKKLSTDDIPDTIVTTVLSALEDREPLTRYFLDQDVDRSWSEQLYDQGRFDDPDVPQLQYLKSIVDVHPDFVVKVITNLDSDDPNTRRAVISTAEELPADAAAQTADVIKLWVSESPSFRHVGFPAVQLVDHLITNGEPNAALTVLQGVFTAPDRDPDVDWGQDRQFEQYELQELLQKTRATFVQECSQDFINVLDEALRQTLDSKTNSDGKPVYESVAGRTPIPELSYDEDNTGKRKHILFTYLSRAAKQWVAAEPTGSDREAFITSYLDDPIPAFRRIGLFLLSQHPDVYRDLIADELEKEPNYDDDSIQYDFYRLVDIGYPYLEADQQNHVYEVLRNGPDERQWIEHRATQVAPDRERSKEEIVRERVDQWRLKRLYLLDGKVSDDQQEYIDDLVEQYGEPERTASQASTPSARGGFVNERGPEDLDTLREQDAETVLQKCVDWDGPDDRRRLFVDGEREDISHWGFAQQIQQLVEEQPAAYAEAIHILEDGKPQYADVVLDTFVDVLQDGGQFPWPPILVFCETVIDEPGRWSSRCRTSIGRLIGQGIQADQTNFPTAFIERVEKILVALASIVDLDPDHEQPQSWIGGVGTTEEEVRQHGIRAIVSYLIWQDQNDRLETDHLEEPLREVLEAKITKDTAQSVRTALGRHFRTFWAVDQELIRNRLDDLFPIEDEEEAKELFAATWNGYAEGNPFLLSAYPYLKPYYHYAVDLLAEDQTEDGLITAKTTASHIGMAYVFEDESLEDEDSLIVRFYKMMNPETAANVAQSFASSLDNEDSELHQYWDAVRKLWQWRLDQVGSQIDGTENAFDYHREFRYFLRCLQHAEVSGIKDEQELIERTTPFLIHRAPHVRILEEWLAEQSARYPTVAISIYHALVEAVPDEDWYNVARSSKDELRESLYTNAVQAGDKAGSHAYKIANRFAATGYEVDKDFLDSYLSEDSSR